MGPDPPRSTPPGRVPLPWHGTDGTDGALATTQVTWKEMLGTGKKSHRSNGFWCMFLKTALGYVYMYINVLQYMCAYHTNSCHSIQCAVTDTSLFLGYLVWDICSWSYRMSTLEAVWKFFNEFMHRILTAKKNNSGFLMVPDVAYVANSCHRSPTSRPNKRTMKQKENY